MTTPLYDPMHGWLTKKYEIQETAANANAARDYAAANAANAEARNAGMLAAARANEMNAQAGHLDEQSAWLGPNSLSEIGQRNAYAALLGGQLQHTNATTSLLNRLSQVDVNEDGTLSFRGGMSPSVAPSVATKVARSSAADLAPERPDSAYGGVQMTLGMKRPRPAAPAASKLPKFRYSPLDNVGGNPLGMSLSDRALPGGMGSSSFLPSLTPLYQSTVDASRPASSSSNFIQSELRKPEPPPTGGVDDYARRLGLGMM